jgi:hypothetical protein
LDPNHIRLSVSSVSPFASKIQQRESAEPDPGGMKRNDEGNRRGICGDAFVSGMEQALTSGRPLPRSERAKALWGRC